MFYWEKKRCGAADRAVAFDTIVTRVQIQFSAISVVDIVFTSVSYK